MLQTFSHKIIFLHLSYVLSLIEVRNMSSIYTILHLRNVW